uniref:PIPK domain-containing protein n=1 Tax=Arcella intermedia TaxID=1963864 RepID=A0A6B2L7U0_9EUKA
MVNTILLPTSGGHRLKPKLFTEYAPFVFREIRKIYGISDTDYLNSIGIETFLFKLLFCGEFNSYRTMGSHGKSGSVFFHTYDSQFMIKTIKQKEAECLLEKLPQYYQYLSSNTSSLLLPFLALYTISDFKKEEEKLYICVMPNLFTTSNSIDEIFDLKGSTLDRTTPLESRKPGVPLKDLDYGDRVMIFSPEVCSFLNNQIKEDTTFLEKHFETMDYSFLIGIHKVTDKTTGIPTQLEELRTTTDGGVLSQYGDRIYYLGIIDYLITFDKTKAVEGLIKRTFTMDEEVSSVSPHNYAIRFCQYLEKKLWFPGSTKIFLTPTNTQNQ